MKTTVMPAYKLTDSCIWTSFQNSNKKHILITGHCNSGKTTLLKQLFPNTLPGITSKAVPADGVYLWDNLSSLSVKVGTYDASLGGEKNKMRPLLQGFMDVAVTILHTALESPSPWISIDEIGYLEAQATEYLDTIHHVMNHKQLIAVLRKQNLPHLKQLWERDDVFLIDLDSPFGKNGCVIMASGLGTRFGENKLMADFHGKPLISYILNATNGIFQKRVVVTRYEEVAKLCEQSHIPVIVHQLPQQSDTIRLGLRSMLEQTNCMFCPADQPFLTQDTLASLALLGANCPRRIQRPAYANQPSSPVIFPAWTYDQLLQLPEGETGSYVIRQHPQALQYLHLKDGLELKDMDTKEDFLMPPYPSEALHSE